MNSEHDSLWEKRIIARVLLENFMLDTPAIASLQPSDFQDRRNLTIFAAMHQRRAWGQRVTIESLFDFLRERGQLENAGGEQYLCDLASDVVALGFGKDVRP